MLNHFKNLDWIMILAVFLLCVFSLLSLYSASLAENNFQKFQKQILFIGLGFLALILFSFFDYKIFKQSPLLLFFIYILVLFALALLFVFGGKIRGIHAWFSFGGFALQPVEFMKVMLILIFAKYFSMRHIEMYRPLHIIISGTYVILPAFLVFLQPDLGSLIILIFLWLGIMIIAGIKLRHLLLLGFIGILLFVLSWNFLLKNYQKERIVSFINPSFDPVGQGYSRIQSQIAWASGGFLGKGLGNGSQVQYKFLPEAQTDFIFSAIAEEFGFMGVSIILILFSILLIRIFRLMLYASDNFARLSACGIALLIFSQIFINVGMNIGILPITGITLPFLSYGGSSLISLFIVTGILQNIKVSSRGPKALTF